MNIDVQCFKFKHYLNPYNVIFMSVIAILIRGVSSSHKEVLTCAYSLDDIAYYNCCYTLISSFYRLTSVCFIYLICSDKFDKTLFYSFSFYSTSLRFSINDFKLSLSPIAKLYKCSPKLIIVSIY